MRVAETVELWLLQRDSCCFLSKLLSFPSEFWVCLHTCISLALFELLSISLLVGCLFLFSFFFFKKMELRERERVCVCIYREGELGFVGIFLAL